jgi:diadenosine tetraphosphate (Ap4A) HIT family hydrolase
MYDGKCKGCRLAHGLDIMPGGFIPLGRFWMINHYGGSEGFLGWLVIQPRQHRMKLSELTDEELCEFGVHIKHVESELCQAWTKLRPNDNIERVYVALFFESAFEKDNYWHIHIHIVPRTKRIGEEKPTDEEIKLGIKDHKGWYIVRHTSGEPDKKDIIKLMDMLRGV